MRKDEFVLRGKTESGETDRLSFSGHKEGYAYRMVEFQIYPSQNIGGRQFELCATVTAAKTAEVPTDPDFSNEGLIAVAMLHGADGGSGAYAQLNQEGVVNDTFLITQDLLISVVDSVAGTPMPVNWQCKFKPVKLAKAEEAVVNYKQFMISDGS